MSRDTRRTREDLGCCCEAVCPVPILEIQGLEVCMFGGNGSNNGVETSPVNPATRFMSLNYVQTQETNRAPVSYGTNNSLITSSVSITDVENITWNYNLTRNSLSLCGVYDDDYSESLSVSGGRQFSDVRTFTELYYEDGPVKRSYTSIETIDETYSVDPVTLVVTKTTVHHESLTHSDSSQNYSNTTTTEGVDSAFSRPTLGGRLPTYLSYGSSVIHPTYGSNFRTVSASVNSPVTVSVLRNGILTEMATNPNYVNLGNLVSYLRSNYTNDASAGQAPIWLVDSLNSRSIRWGFNGSFADEDAGDYRAVRYRLISRSYVENTNSVVDVETVGDILEVEWIRGAEHWEVLEVPLGLGEVEIELISHRCRHSAPWTKF